MFSAARVSLLPFQFSHGKQKKPPRALHSLTLMFGSAGLSIIASTATRKSSQNTTSLTRNSLYETIAWPQESPEFTQCLQLSAVQMYNKSNLGALKNLCQAGKICLFRKNFFCLDEIIRRNFQGVRAKILTVLSLAGRNTY